MDFLFAAFRKDLSRWWQDASALLVWLAIPLVVGGLLTSMMDGGGGAKPQGTLLIADIDDTLLSNAFSAVFSQGELAEIILVEMVTPEEGAARINNGEASGFLTLPAGFGTAVLEQEPVTLTLITNPAQTILPGIIEEIIAVLLDAGFYVQQLLGDEIKLITDIDGAPDSALVANLVVAITDKIDAAQQYAFPPAFEVSIVQPPADKPTLPIALLFFPGIVIMAITFFANAFAGDWWVEREQGNLRRLASAPARLNGLLLGKALGVGVAAMAVGSVILLAGFLYHDIAWMKFLPLLTITCVAAVALFSWFAFLQMIATSQRGANILTTIALFPLLMLGGSFFPFAAMPDGLAALGRMTPNGFVVASMTQELTEPGAWAIELSSWLLLFIIAGLGLTLASWRLRNGFARAY